ncbi:tannase and feruloyl esterase [Aspergillus brunneoviolaceus CBS 621.78]|uniref:Tannase and feruloyl esterase n=1 Tax=Aspergillus brunneoviolaceus CBS 621.78 TaxID=1450534 RepID=A0ACD1G2J3_9EURO|nr:tannase and feruloyl esterase [Aspergillus brunneoviolaceus CBS 621.78]RAH43433.1 tannase and feruloyl esterase [Aspergillus brunneoviolaceus CBS 621.78]
MRYLWHVATLALSATALATSLADVCTISYVRGVLPANGTFLGITLNPDSVMASPVYNKSIQANAFFPATTVDYCGVTLNYSHSGLNDNVQLTYWLPDPADFQNRFLTTGGEAYNINEGSMILAGGVMYGAAAGLTDGGWGSASFDEVFLVANGTVNWQNTYMFAHQAIHELTIIGRQFSRLFYNRTEETKIYNYYQGCSEGGREGWSQAQRFGDDYDGIIAGSPAFRYAQQQVNHLFSAVVEQTLDYYPPPCELDRIVNATIEACDPLDGLTDGVISRSDLCKLHFDPTTLVGTPYACAASSSSGIGLGYGKRQSATLNPAQNGTVTAEAVAVAQTILKGLQDSDGRQGYIPYQPGADFNDAQTVYNEETGSWTLNLGSSNSEFVQKFVRLVDEEQLSSLDNVTYDTLITWMQTAWIRYEDSLQTNNPDLTTIRKAGGKILHFHGESDSSIPTGSSVHYYESVRQIMFPDSGIQDGAHQLDDFYRLFLVPGGAHCASNSKQPNAPMPNTNLAVMIDWVEKGNAPVTLNATVLSGVNEGKQQQLCAWPKRPLWRNTTGSQAMQCIYDDASYQSWVYSLDAYTLPLY